MTISEQDRSDCAKLRRELADGKFHLGREIRSINKRRIRKLCSIFPDEFLSTQNGYKLVSHATDAELDNAIADLRSRVKHLNCRADGLERIRYGRGQRAQRTMFGTDF